MSRTYRALSTLALSVALAATAATAALAAPPTGSTDVNAQREALYQSELAHNLKASAAAGTQAGTDVNAQRKALYESQLAQNLAARTVAPAEDQNDRLLRGIEAAQAERTQAAVEQARAGERNLGPVPVVTFALQPVQAAPGRDVDLVAIALLALVGGLIGGAAATAGWTAANRRRHRVVAA
jgi:hypothetical protein